MMDKQPGSHSEEATLDALYRDVIFEHYRRPHNKGPVDDAQIVTKGNNPVCGDRVTVYGKIGPDGRLEHVGFDGKGCAICMACSSMMTEAVRGKTLEEAEAISDKFKKMMRNEEPFEAPAEVPDMEALEGVRKFSVRVKCATLAWTTLRNGIVEYNAKAKVHDHAYAHGYDHAHDEGKVMTDTTSASNVPNSSGMPAAPAPVPQPTVVPEPIPAASAQPAPASVAAAPASAPANPQSSIANPQSSTVEQLRDALKDIYDPEIPINIVDLGLIYKLETNDGVVNVDMTLTSPHCPIGDQIKGRVVEVLAAQPGVKSVSANLVFDPLWTKEHMTFDGKLQASMLGFM